VQEDCMIRSCRRAQGAPAQHFDLHKSRLFPCDRSALCQVKDRDSARTQLLRAGVFLQGLVDFFSWNFDFCFTVKKC
jgi:hypothetical protein